ncbi:hypothetical protein HYH02_013915 [Chlamydomonas schloesseri]|uniref:Uncharacterized protein n=1 Tax=Chlamydomonas schloesseri TaxID=2026947 RepID=A0A835SXA6_9CHLO|nr:hypothetical protein HYH02_013915 [Chlamydomonas schloesseri]|eukprot:KAG2429964.1 hypothetical protein HYH02_013915 [Chlamydomonas schloesseri]
MPPSLAPVDSAVSRSTSGATFSGRANANYGLVSSRIACIPSLARRGPAQPQPCYNSARTRRLAVCVRAGAEGAASRQPAAAPSGTPHIQAALFTGTYAVVFGLALCLAPQQVFGLLFAAETVSSGWIRVGGILFTLIGWQYLGTAGGDRAGLGALGFYRATVWSRLALSAAFGLLVAIGESPLGLLVLSAMNLVGAASMHLALRRSGISSCVGGPAGGAAGAC